MEHNRSECSKIEQTPRYLEHVNPFETYAWTRVEIAVWERHAHATTFDYPANKS